MNRKELITDDSEENGDPFGFSQFLDEQKSDYDGGDGEKERDKEKILGNREKYLFEEEAIKKTRKIVYEHFNDRWEDEKYRSLLRDSGKMVDKIICELETEFYLDQAPLVIKDEEKRRQWVEYINECAGVTPIERCTEACLEAVTLGDDMEKVCGIIKEYHEGGNDHIAGATYQVVRDLIKYADWGDEFADYVGHSGIDFENDSLEERNEKIQGVAKKLGMEGGDLEDWRFSS